MAEKEFENFLLDIEDGIAVFTVNKPEVHNAFSDDCWRELREFMEWVEENDEIKAVILTGAGQKAFVSGADVRKFAKPRTAEYGIKLRDLDYALRMIETGSKPVIAAVNGYAFGGGCEIALACDIRLCSENAQFGLPETKLGIIPGAGGTQRLSRIVGVGRAKEIILGGRILKGQEAVDAGLAMKCVPQEQLLNEAKALANVMIQRAPLAMAVVKRLILSSATTDIETGLRAEALALMVLMGTEDRQEGVTAFKEKRKPNFKGR